MDLYLVLCYFVIYAFLGWCTEVVFAAVDTGKFVNRGFLNGPICPIYGFGVVIIVILLMPVKENITMLFFGSVALTSALELVTGWLLERLFHTKWWDYSDIPFNIGGYICLKFSFMWGIACMVILNVIHPIIQDFVSRVDFEAGKIILGTALATTAVDLTATVQSVLSLNKQLKQINFMASKIKALSDEIGEILYSESMSFIEKSEELKAAFTEGKLSINELMEKKISEANGSVARLKAILTEKTSKKNSEKLLHARKLEELMGTSFFGQKRLLHAFPNLKSTKYSQALEELKNRILMK